MSNGAEDEAGNSLLLWLLLMPPAEYFSQGMQERIVKRRAPLFFGSRLRRGYLRECSMAIIATVWKVVLP
jgi:hypothetical protein